MPAVLGDFLAAASEHMEAAVVVGDGQLTRLPDVVRDLHRLVAVMSHYLDDLAPCDEVEAVKLGRPACLGARSHRRRRGHACRRGLSSPRRGRVW